MPRGHLSIMAESSKLLLLLLVITLISNPVKSLHFVELHAALRIGCLCIVCVGPVVVRALLSPNTFRDLAAWVLAILTLSYMQ